jgi:PAS domain S-box-containing protein
MDQLLLSTIASNHIGLVVLVFWTGKVPMFSARLRLAIGLTSVVVSVLLVAMNIGIIPDYQEVALEGRSQLCEAIAANCSTVVRQRDLRRLDDILQLIVKRNDELLSAAVRRIDGSLPVVIGEHVEHWHQRADGESSETQIQVPIRSNNRQWGHVELRFRPLSASSWYGFFVHPQTLFYIFVALTTFVLTAIYLGKTLKHMDPSRVVPGRVRSALDTLAEGLLVLDHHHRIMLANQSFAAIVGEAPDKLMGKSATDLPWVMGADIDQHSYPWEAALNTEAPLVGTMLQLKDHSGKTRSFMVNCTPILGNDGKNRGVLASFEDITQLEETQQELSRSKEAADAANQAKSQFLARMSHEIRTPMNAILGFTDVLRRGFESNQEERKEYLETIHASGQHLLNLINDILDLSKVESGRLEVERIDCSPAQLISEAMAVLQGQAQKKGLTLSCESETEIPTSIKTDPVRFRQLLTNLIGNAIKFTERGGVRVIARVQELNTPSPSLAVAIVDTGVGIPADTLDQIFDPFVQADTSVTRKYGGTGLGLAISRRFASALGGELTVESEYGKGSTFQFTVATGSLDGVPMQHLTDQVAKIWESDDQGDISGELPPARILVVDDGDSNRKLISLVLSRAGALVHVARNGQAAVEAAKQHPFDLILMDIQMPVMDGYTATRLLRSGGFESPIIALTADAMKGTEAKCRDAGCTAFLTKPIDMDQLIQSVSAVLHDQGLVSVPSADPNPQPTQAPGVSPLHSSLPTDDPEFCEIIAEFEVRLKQQLEEMRRALQECDFKRLSELAHWLKGAGGTAGFHAFTEPAAQLQQLAAAGHSIDSMSCQLAEIMGLAHQLVVPPVPSTAEPLSSIGT